MIVNDMSFLVVLLDCKSLETFSSGAEILSHRRLLNLFQFIGAACFILFHFRLNMGLIFEFSQLFLISGWFQTGTYATTFLGFSGFSFF